MTENFDIKPDEIKDSILKNSVRKEEVGFVSEEDKKEKEFVENGLKSIKDFFHSRDEEIPEWLEEALSSDVVPVWFAEAFYKEGNPPSETYEFKKYGFDREKNSHHVSDGDTYYDGYVDLRSAPDGVYELPYNWGHQLAKDYVVIKDGKIVDGDRGLNNDAKSIYAYKLAEKL